MGKKIKMLRLIFAFFFGFSFFFHLSLQCNTYYREICVEDSSGTIAPKILKFGTNIGYDLLYCVKENQHAALIVPFICSFFFL